VCAVVVQEELRILRDELQHGARLLVFGAGQREPTEDRFTAP
jgi:hypothetical protein